MNDPVVPQPQTALVSGETLVALWRPQLAMFAQRAVLLSFATAIALSSLGYLSLLQWLIAVPILTVVFVFVFDDHTTWFRHRDELWFLTDRRLIFEKSGTPEENAAVPLGAISGMRLWFWWSLRLDFDGGTTTAIRFVPRPRDIRAQIIKAQQALGQEAADAG